MSRGSKLKSQEGPELATIHECLSRIILSQKYDSVSNDIYRIMCHSEKEPYDQWVETWLIKCITECFRNEPPVKMEIMFACFALFSGFTLCMSIENRLMQYVKISGYLTVLPTKSKRSFDEIEHDPDKDRRKKELKDIANKITRMQRDLIHDLALYIEGLPSPSQHISDLKEYGELKIIKGKKVYVPFPVKLNVPKLGGSSIDGTHLYRDNATSKEKPQQLPTDDYNEKTVPSLVNEGTKEVGGERVVVRPSKSQTINTGDTSDICGRLDKDIEQLPSSDTEAGNAFSETHIEAGISGSTHTEDGGNEGTSTKQLMTFVLQIIGIIAGTIVAIVFILAIWHGKFEIPTSKGNISLDFTRRDYSSERHPENKVAESVQKADNIPVSPSPFNTDNDNTTVLKNSLLDTH